MTGAGEADEAGEGAIERVLEFWFAEGHDVHWFKRDDGFDAAVRRALADDHKRAAAGACARWMETARGCLALVLLLDQVPRNLYRNDARAFATDGEALRVARHAVARGFDREIAVQSQRLFLYLPLEHSENLADQDDCCRLMASLDENPEWAEWSEKHRAVIARFGRFPHRNAVLGRDSSPAEQDFLTQPDSSF